jgi:CBS domain-containing protein
MQPIERLKIVTPETPLSVALEAVGRDDINQLPVVSEGRLRGVISRAHILHYLQTRAEFQV